MDNDDKAAGRKKRRDAGAPAPTIDLEATEVASEPGPAQSEPVEPMIAPEATASEAPPPEAPVTVDATATAEAAPPTGDEGGPWKQQPEAPAGEESPAPKREPEAPVAPALDVFVDEPKKASLLPLALAALAGGVVGGALVLALALAGLVPAPSSGPDALATLAPRLAAIEQDVASARQTLERTTGRVSDLEGTVKGASENATNAINLASEAKAAAANASPGGAPADLSPLTRRLDDADKALAELRAGGASGAQAQGDVDAVKTRLGALEQAVAHNPERVAAYTVALSQLGEAVRAGRPFEPELQAAAALGADTKALDALAPLAAKGTPSVDALAQSFDALAPSLVAALAPRPAPAPAAAEPGPLDRFWSSFGSVVSVTREDEPDASEAAKPVKAVSDALHRGDLAAALTAFAALPDLARTAGAAWFVEAKGALDANALVRAESAAALKTLSGQ